MNKIGRGCAIINIAVPGDIRVRTKKFRNKELKKKTACMLRKVLDCE